jgi:hypothetical protein
MRSRDHRKLTQKPAIEFGKTNAYRLSQLQTASKLRRLWSNKDEKHKFPLELFWQGVLGNSLRALFLRLRRNFYQSAPRFALLCARRAIIGQVEGVG